MKRKYFTGFLRQFLSKMSSVINMLKSNVIFYACFRLNIQLPHKLPR